MLLPHTRYSSAILPLLRWLYDHFWREGADNEERQPKDKSTVDSVEKVDVFVARTVVTAVRCGAKA